MKITELVYELERRRAIWGDVEVNVIIDGANGGLEKVNRVTVDRNVGIILETGG